MKKKVAFFTLGCRVNQYETAAMQELFLKAGYQVTAFDSSADIYVVNTCAVTAESERKCRQVLRRAKKTNPTAVVAAVGCMAQAEKEKVLESCGVDVVVGVNQKHNIVEVVENGIFPTCNIDDMSHFSSYQELKISSFEERDRAFVKIQDGCDNFCSYCIIPYLRGRIRSRNPKDVLNEITVLSEKGFREIVLTGIHVASFGRNTEYALSNLIRDVSKIDGVERIRLSSIDVAAFDADLIQTYQETKKLCPQFHISLQSGSDSVLKRMNRHYKTEEYVKAVEKIRSVRPDTAITTDIITGFPGETEAEFNETMAFVDAIQFSGIHVFPYSERKGTRAAEMQNQVPKQIREERAKLLIQKSMILREKYAKQFVGTTQEVLFEHTPGEPSGFTPHYLRVTLPKSTSPFPFLGNIKSVEIIGAKGDLLYGTVK